MDVDWWQCLRSGSVNWSTNGERCHLRHSGVARSISLGSVDWSRRRDTIRWYIAKWCPIFQAASKQQQHDIQVNLLQIPEIYSSIMLHSTMVQKSNILFFRTFDEAMQYENWFPPERSELMQKLIQELIFKLIMFSLRTRISKLSLLGLLIELKNISSQRLSTTLKTFS